MKQRAVGGWIKDAELVGVGEYLRLEDFSALNSDNVKYFEDYRTRYFSDGLVYGQGTENVFYMLKKYVDSPTSWIDLGASVTTLFWSLGFDVDKLNIVDVCDVVPEALHVLDSFKKTKEIPGCYMDVMRLLGKSKKDIEAMRKKTWAYHVFNCLGEWPISFPTSCYSPMPVRKC